MIDDSETGSTSILLAMGDHGIRKWDCTPVKTDICMSCRDDEKHLMLC